MAAQNGLKFSGRFNGREMKYEVKMELVPVLGVKGEQIGTCSTFSYVADVSPEERAARPVTFLFNGGPGAASCFLHLSGIGVKRVAIPVDLKKGIHGPYVLEDNEHSCFDATDLVFVDPINTGYGRSLPDANLERAYSIEGDAVYFAGILRSWLAKSCRWNSPKFIAGESYGSHRAAFLATELLGFNGIPLDGVVLLGQAINVQETSERPGNITGLIAGIPYKAATALYHGKGSLNCGSADEAARQALEYANSDFALAMYQGNKLSEDERDRVASRLEQLTGLSAEFYKKHRFWVTKAMFRAELLKDEGKALGIYDSRYVGPVASTAFGENDGDTSMSSVMPGITAMFNLYVRETLQIEDDIEYRTFDPEASARWDWTDANSRKFMKLGKASPFETYPYVARLTEFMRQTPKARLFVGTGHYDSLTTIGAVEHLLRTYDIDRSRVTEHWYDGGHMMYTNPAAARLLNEHLRAFFSASA